MNEAERFLKTKTFLCKVFNAKISKKQCEYQCAKVGACFDCMQCKRFSLPTQEDIDKLTNTMKRYADTKNGNTARKIQSYQESSNFLRRERYEQRR